MTEIAINSIKCLETRDVNEKLRLICGVIAARRVATAASKACVTKLHVLVEDWLEDTYIYSGTEFQLAAVNH